MIFYGFQWIQIKWRRCRKKRDKNENGPKSCAWNYFLKFSGVVVFNLCRFQLAFAPHSSNIWCDIGLRKLFMSWNVIVRCTLLKATPKRKKKLKIEWIKTNIIAAVHLFLNQTGKSKCCLICILHCLYRSILIWVNRKHSK